MKNNVHIMALTATVTVETQTAIINTLGMRDPIVIKKIPDKVNLSYAVTKSSHLHDKLEEMKVALQKKRCTFTRTIIFCRTLKDCAEIYDFFHSKLGKEVTEPVGAPNLAQYRLVDMYTSVTVPTVKEEIEKQMRKDTGSLRILLCTNAFGMGVDCKSVHSIIHYQPPADIECYIQKVGRGGRDGRQTQAIIYYDKEGLRNIDKDIMAYCCNTTTCRREYLMQHFSQEWQRPQICGTYKCCDICTHICPCTTCKI